MGKQKKRLDKRRAPLHHQDVKLPQLRSQLALRQVLEPEPTLADGRDELVVRERMDALAVDEGRVAGQRVQMTVEPDQQHETRAIGRKVEPGGQRSERRDGGRDKFHVREKHVLVLQNGLGRHRRATPDVPKRRHLRVAQLVPQRRLHPRHIHLRQKSSRSRSHLGRTLPARRSALQLHRLEHPQLERRGEQRGKRPDGKRNGQCRHGKQFQHHKRKQADHIRIHLVDKPEPPPQRKPLFPPPHPPPPPLLLLPIPPFLSRRLLHSLQLGQGCIGRKRQSRGSETVGHPEVADQPPRAHPQVQPQILPHHHPLDHMCMDRPGQRPHRLGVLKPPPTRRIILHRDSLCFYPPPPPPLSIAF